MATEYATSLPYHEPDIVTILILTSFLLLSNLLNYALDRVLYCGLIGQIFIGVAWGTPGGKWLEESVETSIVQLGYLGLILLVYEGGLSTSFQSLKANILLSILVALTGILAPIGLSFTLIGIANATPLQSFAAGAALCSTSLGTTFTIMGTTGLLKTRLGVVLTSAAMLDDIVGLVMVQVISNVGGSAGEFGAITIIRPVFVSVAFAVVCPLLCWLTLRPVTLKLTGIREKNRSGFINRLLSWDGTAFFFHSALLIGMVTGSTYAGTSNLFAAYLAGAIVSWWDTELPHLTTPAEPESRENSNGESSQGALEAESESGVAEKSRSGTAVYEKFYAPANNRILKPFFFTSVGFSIPITRMFSGSTVWRGIIYSMLMMVGKLLCGAWLIRFSISLPHAALFRRLRARASVHVPHLWGKFVDTAVARRETEKDNRKSSPASAARWQHAADNEISSLAEADTITPISGNAGQTSRSRSLEQSETMSYQTSPATKPFSLYPAAILGIAMVARGEIGFLISSLAESNGIFSHDEDDQTFLIVTWAIFLCTVVGPVGVGLLVRRVKRLEKEKEQGVGGRDVLGVGGWSRRRLTT